MEGDDETSTLGCLCHGLVTDPRSASPPPTPEPPSALPADAEIMSESPENLGFGEPAAVEATSVASSSPSSSDLLSDDLREKILRQVEYYFSDKNLPTDKFLLKYVKKDEGYVPIAVIASFKRMRKLVQNITLIEIALRTSSQLVVSSDGKKVKRVQPMESDIVDAEHCTVLVENLPEDYSIGNIQQIFGDVGIIKNICIRDPHAVQESTKAVKAKLASNKLHALVEYTTVEAAEKAVARLNDESNWRSGMRVKSLLKVMGSKYGQGTRGRKGTAYEKSSVHLSDSHETEQNPASFDNHEEINGEEQEDEQSSGDKGGRQRRNRGRGRSQKQYNVMGHGHASSTTIGPGCEALNKPPPGPKMPDGTRGFTIGRGRSLHSSDHGS